MLGAVDTHGHDVFALPARDRQFTNHPIVGVTDPRGAVGQIPGPLGSDDRDHDIGVVDLVDECIGEVVARPERRVVETSSVRP